LVAKRKKKGPTWSDVKTALGNLDKKQLLKLVADLYRLSGENKTFLYSRFGVGDNPLGPYKKIIEECMCPDIYSNKPIQVSKAKKAISNYLKAMGDPEGEAELMTYFVECGNEFTVNFGDIDGPFYDALNRMYRQTISKVLTLSRERQDEFKNRLAAIMTSSSNIGWGYHDMLCDDYYRAFPEDA
jgi:hypothetical protein